jgi:hypothetical protein
MDRAGAVGRGADRHRPWHPGRSGRPHRPDQRPRAPGRRRSARPTPGRPSRPSSTRAGAYGRSGSRPGRRPAAVIAHFRHLRLPEARRPEGGLGPGHRDLARRRHPCVLGAPLPREPGRVRLGGAVGAVVAGPGPRRTGRVRGPLRRRRAGRRPTDLLRRAGDLAETHALRGYDAVHLASAAAIAHDRTVMVTADRHLRTAARDLGLAAANLHG